MISLNIIIKGNTNAYFLIWLFNKLINKFNFYLFITYYHMKG